MPSNEFMCICSGAFWARCARERRLSQNSKNLGPSCRGKNKEKKKKRKTTILEQHNDIKNISGIRVGPEEGEETQLAEGTFLVVMWIKGEEKTEIQDPKSYV